MRPSTGVIGRTFYTGEPTVELDVASHPDYLAAVQEVVAEVCVPVRVDGRVVGVLHVESTEPLDAAAAPELTLCAEQLGARLSELAPLDVPSPAQALARIGARLAALSEPGAICSWLGPTPPSTPPRLRAVAASSSARSLKAEPSSVQPAVAPERCSPARNRRSRSAVCSSGLGSHCSTSGRSSTERSPKSLRNSGVVR